MSQFGPLEPAVVDTIARATREAATTAPKRMSVAEMNQASFEQLATRLRNQRDFDDRSVVTRVLDMIDLPRNVVWNIAARTVAPGAVREARETGDRGTFGLTRINASDVLRSLGVKNQIINGVVGFAGDVALDPLTYLGPAGAGLKLAGTTGRSIQVGRAGRKALLRGIEASAAGRAVANPVVDELLQAARGVINAAPDQAARLANAKTPEEIASILREFTVGVQSPTNIVGSAGRAVAPFLGFDAQFRAGTNSILARHLDDAAHISIDTTTDAVSRRAALAARSFYRRYGKAADAPFREVGLRFGAGGSQILHVPFTEFGLAVPAFTPEGRLAQNLQQIAGAGKYANVSSHLVGPAQSIREGILTTHELTEQYQQAAQRIAGLDPLSPEYAQAVQELGEIGQNAQDSVDAVRNTFTKIRPADIRTLDDERELLYQAKLVELANTDADALRAQAKALSKPENLEAVKIVRAEIDERVAQVERAVEQGDLRGLPDIPTVPVTLKAWEDELEAAMPGTIKGDPLAPQTLRQSQGGRFGIARTSADQLGRGDLAVKAFALRQREQNAANLRAGVAAGLGDEQIDDYYGRLTSFPASDAKVGDTVKLYDRIGTVEAVEPTGVRVSYQDAFQADKSPDVFTIPMTGVIPGIEGTHSRSELASEIRKALQNGQIPDALMERVRVFTRNAEIARSEGAYQSWLKLSDAAFQAQTDVLPRLIEQRASLTERYANLLSAPIEEIASLRGDKGLVQLGRFLLGTDDATIAVTPFGTLAQALDDNKKLPGVSAVARDMDRTFRKHLGWRGGALHEVHRKVIRAVSDDALRRNTSLVLAHITSDLHSALRAANLPETQIELASRGLLARMVLLKQQAGAYFPTHMARVNGRIVETEHPIASVLKELADLNSPEFISKLDEVASKHILALDRIGAEAVSRGILEHTLKGNIPNRFHGSAREIAQRAYRSKNLEDATLTTLGSTAQRTTKQYRFQDSDGNLHRIFDYEFERYAKFTDDQIQAMTPQRRGEVLAVQKSIAQWKKMLKELNLSDLEGRMLYGKDTDPFEFNALTASGAMSAIAEGGRPVIEDAAMLLAGRYADHHADIARVEFNDLLRREGIDAYADQIRHVSDGGTITLDSGMKVRVATRKGRDGKDVYGIERNGTFYRALNPTIVEASDLKMMSQGADPAILTRLYPAQVADMIEGVHAIFASRQSTNDLLMAADQLTRAWKTTTLMHPSWTAANIVGSLSLLTQAGANMPKVLANMVPALKAAFSAGRAEALQGIKIGNQNAADLVRHMHEQYVTAGFMRNTTPDEILAGNKAIFASDHLAPHGLRESVKDPKAAAAKLNRRAEEIILHKARERVADEAIARRIAEERAGDWRYKGWVLAGVTASAGVRTWFKANQRLEDAFRLAAMASWMDDGFDAVSAAQATKNALFDYLDFTQTESQMRRFLPFYSWMKNNLAFQLQQLMYRPAQVAMTPKLIEAIEEVTSGESQVPIHLRPRWMANQLAVQMGANPDARWSIGIADVLPTADLAANWAPALLGGIEGAQHSANRLVSGVNPVLKAPVEFAAGTEFFSGRSIGPDAVGSDLSAVEFAANQLRPARELGILANRKGPIPRAAEQGPGALAARALLGGRAQDFSAERLSAGKLREYMEAERELRQAIYRNAHNDMDTIGPRSELMRLYMAMMRDGYDDDVPKWAQEQIALLVE